MVPVTPMFPLLKLPYLGLKNVLEMISAFDLIKASVCSRRLKRLIRSVFPKPSKLKLCTFLNQLNLSIHTKTNQNFTLDSSNSTLQGPSILGLSGIYGMFGYERPYEQISIGFDARDWIQHLAELFNCNGIHLEFYCDSFEMDDINRVIEGLEIQELILNDSISVSCLVRALELFKPTKKLSLHKRPIKEEPFLRDIITRKYDSIEILFELSIEEVLSLNSKSIELGSMSAIKFNRIMKRWIDGWNPELTQLKVLIEKTPQNIKRESLDGMECHRFTGKWESRDGCEVRNRFGQKAFITFDNERREIFSINRSNFTCVYFDA